VVIEILVVLIILELAPTAWSLSDIVVASVYLSTPASFR
jgi:hypothetical protein